MRFLEFPHFRRARASRVRVKSQGGLRVCYLYHGTK
jgi:hypothetical protein